MAHFIEFPLTFKLPLLDLVKSLPNQAEHAFVWKNILLTDKTLQSEELKLAGVMNLTEAFNESKVTKNALLDYLRQRFNSIMPTLSLEVIDEYRPSLYAVPLDRKSLPIHIMQLFEGFNIKVYQLPSFHYRFVKVYYDEDLGNKPRWFLFDQKWKMIISKKNEKNFKNGFEAFDVIYSLIKEKFKKATSQGTSNYFENYAFFGGDRYKEWFVSLNNMPRQYVDKHFQISNLIFHIRSSEWVDTENQKLFLIDEIQSDWYNEKRHDESGKISEMPYFKKWIELAVKIAIVAGVRAGFKQIAFTTSVHHVQRYRKSMESFEILYDKEIPKVLAKIERKFGCTSGWRSINAGHSPGIMRRVGVKQWQVRHDGGKPAFNPIENKEIGLFFLKKSAKTSLVQVRSIQTTPYLAEAIVSNTIPLIDW